MDILLLTFGIYSCVTLIGVTCVFLLAQVRNDNSIMDICYGPLYAIATWATIYLTQTTSFTAHLIAGLVTVWATRLALRIGKKNWGRPEDPRYAAWRNAWQQRGMIYFILRSYIQINLLQGIIIILVSTPMIIVINAQSALTHTWLYAGIAVFSFGLLYEAIADWQLDRFIKGKRAGTESATLMTRGLFAYSRRPNYFGESVIWWGLALLAFSLPYGHLALISPLVITFILTRVTGPMLEKNFLNQYPEAYADYQQTTNYFIPGPARLND